VRDRCRERYEGEGNERERGKENGIEGRERKELRKRDGEEEEKDVNERTGLVEKKKRATSLVQMSLERIGLINNNNVKFCFFFIIIIIIIFL
jgi:hypothetical protein